MTSSIAPKDEDSSRDLWSRCRFAVRRPGNPVASPRSHGVPRLGLVLGSALARFALADDFEYTVRHGHFRGGEAAFPPRREGQGFGAAIRMNDEYPDQRPDGEDPNPYSERTVAGAPSADVAWAAGAEQSVAGPPPTCDDRVNDAVAGLSRLQGRPAEEHVAVLEEVHGRLRDILDDLDPARPEQR